jgi:hypothetical protein
MVAGAERSGAVGQANEKLLVSAVPRCEFGPRLDPFSIEVYAEP